MKRITTLSILLLAAAGTQLAAFQRQRIDDGWRFQLGDSDIYASATFDDSRWRTLDLPHDWSIEGQFDREAPAGNDGAYLPTGIGWYRLKINTERPQGALAKKLYFEGVYERSTVYVNGTEAGGHAYGYSSFWVDVSSLLRDGENVIAVRVDNSHQKNCRWYSGSGIYRHVWLCEMMADGSDDPWQTAIRTEQICGISADGRRADSAVICIGRKNRPDERRTFRDIALWSPEQPTLYTIELDGLSVEYGFRKIEFSANGLRLNGQPYLLNGGCLHHDNGCLGAAAFDAAEWRKARLMKEAGFNAVRTSHNPPSEEFLRACDHLGLLVIDEAFDGLRAKKNAHDYHELIDKHWQSDVDALVLRDRNHPCVMAWSNGNELYERKKIEVITTSRKLAARMRQLDPTRPVTQALCEVDSIFDPLAETLDIAGYNYLIDCAERDHKRCPERIIWQTESYPDSAFQSWVSANDLPYVLGDFVWTALDYLGESGIGRAHYAHDTADRGEHWEGSKWPWHGAYCGDIDLTGLRKPISHYRQILWDSIPRLAIGVREPDNYVDSIIVTRWSTWTTVQSWTWPGHEGKPIQVEVYSRYPEVRLYLNDRLIGQQPTTRAQRYKATFTLPYEAGTLRAVGVLANGAESAPQTLQTADRPAAIRLTADRTRLTADGQDLAFVTVELVDRRGNVIPSADQQLTLRVTGAGSLAAVANGNMLDMDSYAAHVPSATNTARRHLWKGRALAVVRTGHQSGRITLRVTGAGLSQSLTLRAK